MTDKEMAEYSGPNKKTVNEFACGQCGANLQYKPGTRSLHCDYCGNDNEIPVLPEENPTEQDFHAILQDFSSRAPKMELSVVNCTNCGANTSLDPHIQSANCPYCANPLVVSSSHTENLILPGGILPFKLNKEEAKAMFKKWVKGLWFAPNDLKRAGHDTDRFNGIYMPYWTFDSQTETQYVGQVGTHYYETEHYWATEDGKRVQRSRQVRKTRWRPVSGHVSHFFDDVLILAAKSLPTKYVEKLEPWDIAKLEAFKDAYLGGFITEKYQVGLEEGFNAAKSKMEREIQLLIKRHIGGDEQRINYSHSEYNGITFKHILLPVYVSAFRYKNKVYRFLVNGRTGEVQGERPYSTAKIVLTILAVVIVIGALIAIFAR